MCRVYRLSARCRPWSWQGGTVSFVNRHRFCHYVADNGMAACFLISDDAL